MSLSTSPISVSWRSRETVSLGKFAKISCAAGLTPETDSSGFAAGTLEELPAALLATTELWVAMASSSSILAAGSAGFEAFTGLAAADKAEGGALAAGAARAAAGGAAMLANFTTT